MIAKVRHKIYRFAAAAARVGVTLLWCYILGFYALFKFRLRLFRICCTAYPTSDCTTKP